MKRLCIEKRTLLGYQWELCSSATVLGHGCVNKISIEKNNQTTTYCPLLIKTVFVAGRSAAELIHCWI